MANVTCQKCGKTMDEGQFYTYKDGRKTELCKKCLTMHIDNFDESTYLWLLEKMDVPYIPGEWNTLRDKAYAKDPLKMNGMSVFGKYLSKMKLKQWKDYSWKDNEKLASMNAEKAAVAAAQQKEVDEMLRERYEKGEISDSEFKTLTTTSTQNSTGYGVATNPYLGPDNPFNENNFMAADAIPDPAAHLTEEDKIYLAMKWGRLYQASEWLELERNYEEMMNSFDIQDADSKNTLVLLCKTNLKANQSIDNGDIEGFQKLSKVAESLRKSAKFTAAQNKETKEDYVDSIGQLVSICEKEGFIPRYCTDIPQDKVDKTLADMKGYVYKLVTQDLGFGQQIEDALKKIEIQRQMNAAAEAAEERGELALEMEDEDITDFYQEIREQKEQDLETLSEEEEE